MLTSEDRRLFISALHLLPGQFGKKMLQFALPPPFHSIFTLVLIFTKIALLPTKWRLDPIQAPPSDPVRFYPVDPVR